MANKKIKKKPSKKVKSLGAPTRGAGYKMSADWKVPSTLVDGKYEDRATSLEICWVLDRSGKSKDLKEVIIQKNERAEKSQINLNSLTIGRTTYTRQSYYPFSKKPMLNSVTVKVRGINTKGKGEWASATRKFALPRKPSIAPFAFNTETGDVTSTITTNAGTDYHERYDTRFGFFVYDSRTKKTTYLKSTAGSAQGVTPRNDTATSINLSYDVGDYQGLGDSDYIRVGAWAYSRGFAGRNPSEKEGEVSKDIYVSYPAKAQITGWSFTGKTAADRCVFKVKTNHSTYHPVDRVELCYLANVEYASKTDIPGDVEWTRSGIKDDAACTALAISVANLIPSRGNHTWVVLRTHHLSEDVLWRYSDPLKLTDLEPVAATPAQIKVKVLWAKAGDDGKSIIVKLGWNADGRDDYTGTELSWSDDKASWKSTKTPETHEFTWSDPAYTYEGVTYQNSAEITIKDLSEGTTYYIQARRYLEGDNEEYSSYSNQVECMTTPIPESIVASCKKTITAGSPLDVRWTLSGNGLQKTWAIIDSVTGTSITNGEGAAGAAQIDANRLDGFIVNNTVTFYVEASTGGKPVRTDDYEVSVVTAPTLSIASPSVMESQESFYVTATSNRACNVAVVVTSQGISGQSPEGYRVQPNGDTIHSDVYDNLSWTESEGTYTTTITLPPNLDFWDLGKYTISATAIDEDNQLTADAEPISFSVAWSHQAPVPDEAVTLTPIDTVDEDGDHTRAVEIDLTPPENSNETDVYDIYRMDVENPSIIGIGFPLTHTVVDEYAPFGHDMPLKYRIAVRTVDGDVEFSDIEYEAQCNNLRFDWAGGSLELPYGNSMGDSYKKDAEIRHHMDGSVDGYWNSGVERTSNLGSCIVKILQPRDIEKTRLLARYTGPVFVRLPDGSAYEASVEVSDLSVRNEAVTTVSIDTTEIGLTQEFMLPVPFILEEPQDEEPQEEPQEG